MKSKSVKILLVEDDAIIALQQKRILSRKQYSVTHVFTGEEAVEYCNNHRGEVDLILMDIDLGSGIDGTVAAKRISEYQDIPLIFISSHSEKETVEKTESITNYGYVVKGSGNFVLEAAIKMALKLFDAHRETLHVNHKLSATLDALPDLVFEVGLSGRYYDFHAPSNDILAIPADKIINSMLNEALPKTAADTVMLAIQEAHKLGVSKGKQIELSVPAGKLWFELSVVKKLNTSSGEPKFIVVSRDITENKQKESKILRLNQVYTALTLSSQAVSHSKNIEELFDKICENLVNNGGMASAWIGLVNEDNERIIPVSFSGDGYEWIKELHLSRDPNHPNGKGLIGNLFRNQKEFFCQNIISENKYAQWHEGFNKFHWASTAGLPLIEKGKVIGILIVYSHVINAFDDDIKKLLLEVSNDICYALDNFKIESAKKAADLFIKTVTDILPSMLGYWTSDLKCHFANHAYIEWFGRNPDDIIGLSMVEVLGKILFQKNEPYIKKVLKGIPQTFERTLIKANGEIGYTQAQYIPDTQNGKVIGFIALINDITTEKLAEVALQKAEHLSRATLDALSAHIAILDEKSTVISVNQAWKDFANDNHLLSENYSIGLNYIEICESAQDNESDGSENFASMLRDVIEGRTDEVTFEYPCHGLNEKRWFVAHITKFKSLGPVRIVVAHENITKRKLAEFSLIENEAKFKKILEHIVDAVIIIDTVGTIQMANKSTETLFGYTLQEIIGENVKILMPPPYSLEHDQYLTNYSNTGIKKIIGSGREILAIKKNGEVFPIDLSVSEWMFEGEKFFTGIIKDITYRKKMEEHLKQSQKLEALGQISGGIAHDFNNILAILMGNLELIARKIPQADSQMQGRINASLKAVDRGSQLTKKLLAFARKQTFSPQNFDLNEVVEDLDGLLSRVIGKEIEIKVETTNQPLPVYLDKNELQNVILNLAINARDAMDNSGTLTVRTDISNKIFVPEEISTSEKEKLYAELTVLDTGTGIPEQIISKIFEPFFTTKAQDKGTGLGLSLTYGFVKQSDGFIKVYSELGKGTCFKLYFPLSEEKNLLESVIPVVAEIERDLSKNHNFLVLVVDDELAMVKIATTILTDLGYQVETASNSSEAIVHLKNSKIDLIITDIIMPGELNGIALAKYVQENYPSIKIILSSGFPGHLHEKESVDLKKYTFMEKPYRVKEFERRVWDKLNDKV